jgi:hypothetical protein
VDGEEEVIRLAYAEALFEAGDRVGAREAIASAKERLTDRAARIQDPELRKSFLERVPENARTMALAREWIGAS